MRLSDQLLLIRAFSIHEPVVNRLVMCIVTAALFMGPASLCSNHVRPTIFGFSVPGFLGCGIAMMMGFRITHAIRRSGQK